MQAERLGPSLPRAPQVLKVMNVKPYNALRRGSRYTTAPVASSMMMDPPLVLETMRLQGGWGAPENTYVPE